MMEIEEFKKKRSELQINITTKVFELVESFKKETGFSPNSIYINMTETTSFSDTSKSYTVIGVKVDVEI